MQKFGRRFRLTIDPKDGGDPIVLELPFTVQFAVKRDVMASLNTLSIDIYNLSEVNRRRIYQDRWDLQEAYLNGVPQGRRSAKLEIGYSELYTVYEGDIFSASSAREGVNIITRVECLSGIFDIAASQANLTIAEGQSLANVLKQLVGLLPSVKLGGIGNFPYLFQRPVVLNGNTWQLIQQYTDGNAFIDNGKVFILQNDEAIEFEVTTLDVSTGLLETPRREYATLTITTLMEANIKIGQLVNVFSTIEPVYNGVYKVVGVQHVGVISGAVSGDCRSSFYLQSTALYSYKTVKPL